MLHTLHKKHMKKALMCDKTYILIIDLLFIKRNKFIFEMGDEK